MFDLSVARIIGLLLAVSVVLTACNQADQSTSTTPTVVSTQDVAAAAPQLKVGYVNSAELLTLLPEATAADKSLQNYIAGQERRFQNLATEYQEKVADAQQRGASMTPMEQRIAMREIGELEQKIQEMQAGSQERIARRRDEILAPVLMKADSIIRAVAEENEYDLIYDAPALMYADTTLNVMPLIKQALGLAPVEEEPAEEAAPAAADSSAASAE